MARNRLMQELREINKNPDPDIFLEMTGDTIEEWIAKIRGPKDSPYEGGTFRMDISCSTNYPMSPPKVTFVTKIFHPNVNFTTGELCLDILKTDWSPAWTLQYVCRAVIALLLDPNADSPLNCDAGNLLRSGDVRGFNSMARMYTQEHAVED
eukprot:CAMPEP_0206532222 /NCGR_PEP_ID=MMETSP0325_2-20121206/4232_1 /ASSEMBLY_ACC=CAM_ASM_000347 /TAXON_ID=2866 /ORGANISM="Crypthecodinium cohnii, Strain Seligo" /LENGTH=151 /DNA_ID=CAMNT_0054028615 /DNA_START=59 /DNA_END=514 /DNA_ORIENTATION=+